MGEIGAAEFLARRALGDGVVDALEIARARRAAALGDALGDFADAGVKGGGHGLAFPGARALGGVLLRLGG